MTCQDAKKISLVSIFDKIGVKKAKQNNREIWYLSPFRKEATGSLKIDLINNIWFDHGEGIGGNVLDFVMRYYKCELKDALVILDNESLSFHQPTHNFDATEKEKNYEIREVLRLTNSLLIQYIQSRKLCLTIAKKYCVELRYYIKTKLYYAIGFRNNAGGYEIRNKYVKMCLGKKAPTYFTNNSNQIILLESWSDFLSFLTLYPNAETSYDYLILNSVGTLNNVLIKKTNNYLYKCTNGESIKCINNALYKELKYENIICCFDNDDAGNKATEKILKTFPIQAKDGRNLYAKHKDLNDYLLTINHNDLT